jgi:hypothetical protein
MVRLEVFDPANLLEYRNPRMFGIRAHQGIAQPSPCVAVQMWHDVIEVRLILSARCTRLVEKLDLRREIRYPLWITSDRT